MISSHRNAMPGGVLCVRGFQCWLYFIRRVWPDLGGIFHTEEMPCNGEFVPKIPTGIHYTSYMRTLQQMRNWLLAELCIRL